jgi:ATP/maltotriose-dependent transcriptional regulator MalT
VNKSYVPARFRPHTSTRDTLARPRLVARATSAPPLSAALTLITGPAGFGKTTLLCEIARHLAAGGWRTAWLNCSSADRDPEVFLESLSLAIQQVVPSLRLAPQSIEALGAGLHAAPFNIALHIDEYELIASSALDAALESLTRVAPQNVRLFVAARPPAPRHFVALELDGLVRHVGAAELRFDDAEAQILLGAAPTDEVMTLVRRADGWPFVLQLARLNASTRGKGSEMSGALRIPRERLFQFLAAEVMSSLGEEVQDFVIQTSLLVVVGAPEAEALTGRGDCLALMRRLGSLEPIVLIEPEPYQVRFHPLLQEYLLSRLRERGPAVVADLHRRIAEHFARCGRTIEAVEHALAGGLFDLAISIVENAGGVRYVVAHGVTQARALLDLLPEETVRSRLRLRLMSIGCLADHQRGTDSSVQLEALEKQLEQGEFAAEHDAEAALDLEVARGIVNFVRLEHEVEPPDWQALQRATQRVRRLFCDDPRLWIAPMVTEIRRMLRHGSLVRAGTLIDDLIELNERGHRLRGALDAWLHRAMWAQAKGDLSLAAEVAGSVLGKCLNLYGHEASHEGQLGSAVLGTVLYLRGDIEGALHHFRNLDVKQPSIQFEVYVARYVSRAVCEMATGQQALARERLETGRHGCLGAQPAASARTHVCHAGGASCRCRCGARRGHGGERAARHALEGELRQRMHPLADARCDCTGPRESRHRYGAPGARARDRRDSGENDALDRSPPARRERYAAAGQGIAGVRAAAAGPRTCAARAHADRRRRCRAAPARARR